MTASAARQVHQAMLENAALQIRVELVRVELRQAAVSVRPLLEARPMRAHERMQERVFRAARRVAIGA